ncbi:hypothetical protein MCNF_42990 [Mycolicibacterium confluentis]|uniref:Alanine and proline rich membrane protein n=1 Tax=Mycolicibacterium confluentis TaxID=28047 RepID=A0A7I7Y305_9MYCO|nr:hypothetical protein MCNF_42990 [Mycolicibacterium confluentis]
MSDAPFGGLPPAPGTPQPHTGMTHAARTPIAPPPWPPQGPPPARRPSRLPLVLVSLLAVAALAVAIASWFRPAPAEDDSTAPQYSEQEIADANAAVCDAYHVVYAALTTASSRISTDPTDTFVLSVELKLALHASGDYLNSALRKNPATPQALAAAINKLADTYHRAILDQLADAPAADIESRRADIRSAELAVRRECGV